MRRQGIPHNHPGSVRREGDGLRKRGDDLHFCPRIADRWRKAWAGNHVELRASPLGAVAGIFPFESFDIAGTQGGDLRALDGLEARHCIRTDRVSPVDRQRGGLLIGRTPLVTPVLEEVGLVLGGLEPRAPGRRLSIRLLLKNDPHWREKSTTRSPGGSPPGQVLSASRW